MKNELDKLAESVFAIRYTALAVISKNLLQALETGMSEYLVNNLTDESVVFDYPYINLSRSNDTEYQNGIQEKIRDRYLKTDVSKTPAAAAKKEHANRTETNRGNVAESLDGINHRLAAVADNVTVKELAGIVSVGGNFANAVYKLADGLWDDEKIEAGFSPSKIIAAQQYHSDEAKAYEDPTYRYIPNKRDLGERGIPGGKVGYDIGTAFNVYSSDAYELISDALPQIVDVGKKTAEFHINNEGKGIDIKKIEDALAQQLHQEIAAGFPMYMR